MWTSAGRRISGLEGSLKPPAQATCAPWLARAEGRRAMLPERMVSDSRFRR